jgi:hypothetical protein
LVLPRVGTSIVAVRRVTPGDASVVAAGPVASGSLTVRDLTIVDVSAPGHNLPRYRPDEVTAAILGR